MQPRDPRRLESEPFDVAVIGGGIYGLALAYEAASRGLRTGLVEASDFGGGVSFNHQKTAHGGLRSLQSGRLDRARESIRERRALARIAPRFLRPLPFLVGTYPSLTRNRFALQAAFLVDRIVGADRNDGVATELHLPAARLVSRERAREIFPDIAPQGLSGGAVWYDYQMTANDRLTLAFAAAADQAGAVLVNYAEATDAIREGRRIAGLVATDRLTGRKLALRASLTINAAGGQAGRVMALFGVDRPFPLVRVMSLMTSRPARDHALAAPDRAGRMLTLVPWRDCALVGTSHSDRFVTSDDVNEKRAQVERFISEATVAFPSLQLTRDCVTLVHEGLVPGAVGRGGRPDLKPSHEILDHSADGAPGAMTVVSVKYTTARGVAEHAITAVGSLLRRQLAPSRTASVPLPGAEAGDHTHLVTDAARRHQIELSPQVIARLASLYGGHAGAVVDLTADAPALREAIEPASPVIGAEVVHAIRNEMAVRLSDIVLRRMAFSARHPGASFLEACAKVAAAELQWTEEERRAQVAEVDAVFDVP